jgi:hypothetical protein
MASWCVKNKGNFVRVVTNQIKVEKNFKSICCHGISFASGEIPLLGILFIIDIFLGFL